MSLVAQARDLHGLTERLRFTGIIDAILEADAAPEVPRKQRHTAYRIFERLRDEHGFTGGYTIVKDYVRSQRQSVREAFVPLHHPPGHAQVDFGEAVVEIGGIREKIAFFCLILPHSDVWFVKAYAKETTEAFLDGHVSAFAFLGGVPCSILYDNTTLAVARILGNGERVRTRAFTHLQSHYLFRDRYLAWLSLTFLERLPGLAIRPLPVTIGRYDYRSGFVARRSAEDLPPFRRFEAILRKIALGQRH